MTTTEWGRVSHSDPINGTTTTVVVHAEENGQGVEFNFKVKVNTVTSPSRARDFFLDFEPETEQPQGEPNYGKIFDGIIWDITNALDGVFDLGMQLTAPDTPIGNLINTTLMVYGRSLDDLEGEGFGLYLENAPNQVAGLKLLGQFEQPNDLSDKLRGALESEVLGTEITFETLKVNPDAPGGNNPLIFTSADEGGPLNSYD